MTLSSGSYQAVSRKDWDVYLKAIGVGFDQAEEELGDFRLDVTFQDPAVTLAKVYPSRTYTQEFELGRQFRFQMPDGAQGIGMARQDGARLIQQMRGVREITAIWKFDGDDLTETVSTDGITATTTYQRITT
ncbi:lipocalin/fatty-acid binding family protein [Streptomyces sp. CA-243310]|uniref:lipocalin/fatty-acid binding family protein n=1 Tax=Streptomyces sp. CA-243310 TaxID=3240056 RepID=UPI003D933A83